MPRIIIKRNSIHRSHIRLHVALTTNAENCAHLMRPEARDAVARTARQIGPLLIAAEDAAEVTDLQAAVVIVERQIKKALRRIQQGVRCTWPVRPEALHEQGALNLGMDAKENRIKLEALNTTLKRAPEFVYPPDLQPAELEAMIQRYDDATAALQRGRTRVEDAQTELRILRPQVERVWEEYKLEAWILANVDGHSNQLVWGLEPKRQRRLDEEQKAAVEQVAVEKAAEKAAKKAEQLAAKATQMAGARTAAGKTPAAASNETVSTAPAADNLAAPRASTSNKPAVSSAVAAPLEVKVPDGVKVTVVGPPPEISTAVAKPAASSSTTVPSFNGANGVPSSNGVNGHDTGAIA